MKNHNRLGIAAAAVTAALAAGVVAPTTALAEYRGFPDLDEGHWAVSGGTVDWSVDHDVIHGYPDGSWAPGDVISRSQVAVVLHNLAGNPEPSGEASFADAESLGYAAEAAAWCQEEGVFEGNAATGAFEGDLPLTREQAAKVLCAWAGGEAGDPGALAAFPDADGVSEWARGTMSWAVGAGVVTGAEAEDGARTLAAQVPCTRAEFVTMLMRATDGVMAGVDLDGLTYRTEREWVPEYDEVEVPVYESRWVEDVYRGDCYHVYCISCGYGVYIPWDIATDNMAVNHKDWDEKYCDVIWHVQRNDCDYPREPGGIYETWGTGDEKVYHEIGLGTGHWEDVQVGTRVERVESGGHWEWGEGSWS